jgi:hypothetical protein
MLDEQILVFNYTRAACDYEAMSKRSRRLGKRDELRAVQAAIGKSLGKKTGADEPQTARERAMAGNAGRKLVGRQI